MTTRIEDQNDTVLVEFDGTIGMSGSDQARIWLRENQYQLQDDGSYRWRWNPSQFAFITTKKETR